MSSWWKDATNLVHIHGGDVEDVKRVLCGRLIEWALNEQLELADECTNGDMDIEGNERTLEEWQDVAVFSIYRQNYTSGFVLPEGFALLDGLNQDERKGNRGRVVLRYRGVMTEQVAALLQRARDRYLPAQQVEISRSANLLVKDYDGLSTRSIGFAAVEFVRENYALPVVEQFATVCRELQSPTPCGRLAVLTGPPGTGKTFWIRGLMAETSNLVFLFIPASLAQMAASPEMVPVLLELRQADHRTVLIIEDAAALLQRDSGQQADISTLLNLTSGVIGELLDVCVIATTNAQYVQVDDALKREGRMICGEINLDNLSSEQATAAYQRLGGEGTCESMTLAQVYARARERGE